MPMWAKQRMKWGKRNGQGELKFNIRGAGCDSIDNDASVDTEKSSKWKHQEMQTSREMHSCIGPSPKWDTYGREVTEANKRGQEEACGVFLNFLMFYFLRFILLLRVTSWLKFPPLFSPPRPFTPPLPRPPGPLLLTLQQRVDLPGFVMQIYVI